MCFAAEIEYIILIFKTMLKENQRVVDLSNVDTNAKAFILGVQCGFQFGNKSIDYLEHGILRVAKDWRYTDYNIFKDFVEREFDATVVSYDNERIKNGFIKCAQKKCYDIDINEYRYVRCYRYYKAYIRGRVSAQPRDAVAGASLCPHIARPYPGNDVLCRPAPLHQAVHRTGRVWPHRHRCAPAGRGRGQW